MRKAFSLLLILGVLFNVVSAQNKNNRDLMKDKPVEGNYTFTNFEQQSILINDMIIKQNDLFINSDQIAMVNVIKDSIILDKYGIKHRKALIEIALKPEFKLLNYSEIIKKYHVDPSLKWVINHKLILQPENVLIEESLLKSIRVLRDSPLQPPVPHLPNEELVYLQVEQ